MRISKMPCLKCLETPGYHSFSKIGKVNENTLFYTAPAKSLDKNEDGQKLQNISLHIEEEPANKPWIWILDCGAMTMEQCTELNFNKGIVDLLSANKYVQEIWILRPNVWVKTAIAFFQTFSTTKIFSNIFFIDGSKLEQSENLQKRGADAKTANWLMQQE